MSDIKEPKRKFNIEESGNSEDKITTLLLSKDLINQINSDDDFIRKENQKDIKDQKNKNITNYFQSSDSSNEEEPETKEEEKEIQNNIFNCDFFKSYNENKREKSCEINAIIKENENEENNFEIFGSKLYNSSLLYKFNTQNGQQYIGSDINSNKTELIKGQNPLSDNNNNSNLFNQNQSFNRVNYINSCFTMNGEIGWICTYCKNFNKESKYIISYYN